MPWRRELSEEDKSLILAALWDHSFTALAIVGPDDKILYANKAFQRITKFSEAELQTKTYQEFTHPADIAIDENLAHSVKDGDRDDYDMYKRYIDKFEEIVWVILRVNPVRDSQGDFRYYIAQVQEVERRRPTQRPQSQNASNQPSKTVKHQKAVQRLSSFITVLNVAVCNWKMLSVISLLITALINPKLFAKILKYLSQIKDALIGT